MNAPCHWTLAEARRALESGECSSEELTRAVLDRAEAVEPRIRAYLRLDPERAIEAARQADTLRAAPGDNDLPPLLGLPVAIKDNLCTTDFPTTCASKMLADFHPPYDATAVTGLRRSGAVLLGKTNLDEFAMGSSCENSAMQPTANPWDPDRIPGGSSGGSAAAVAADAATAALGSDTGGSIRQPASHCGVVGLKPTYGRVSRYGLVAFGSSLDQIGPLAKSVEDAALLLNAVCGHDERDATSAPVEVPDFTRALDRKPEGLTLGLPREYLGGGLDPEVERVLDEARALYEKLGVRFKEVSLPHTEYAVATYYIVATAEASSNLGRYDGAQYGFRATGADNIIDMYARSRGQGFGPEVKRRIMLGTYVLSAGFYDAYYLRALKVRTLIRRDFEQAFGEVDALLTPVSPTPAFGLGEKTDDPLTMYLSDVFTISTNLAGIPGLALPAGLSKSGLPVGLQLLAPNFEEERLLSLGHAFERERGFRAAHQPAL